MTVIPCHNYIWLWHCLSYLYNKSFEDGSVGLYLTSIQKYNPHVYVCNVTPALFCCQVLQTVNTNLVSELHERISIFGTANVPSDPLQYFFSAFPSFKVHISAHTYYYFLAHFTKFVPDITSNNLWMHCLRSQGFKTVTVQIVVSMITCVCVSEVSATTCDTL